MVERLEDAQADWNLMDQLVLSCKLWYDPPWEVIMPDTSILLACVLVGEIAYAADLHVAPTGKDAHPGTQAAPFATLTRARDAVREMKKTGLPAGGITVWVHKGTYYLADSFTLTAEDGGTADRPIVYSAAPNEEVRIVG